jgi:hypothetical protein
MSVEMMSGLNDEISGHHCYAPLYILFVDFHTKQTWRRENGFTALV